MESAEVSSAVRQSLNAIMSRSGRTHLLLSIEWRQIEARTRLTADTARRVELHRFGAPSSLKCARATGLAIATGDGPLVGQIAAGSAVPRTTLTRTGEPLQTISSTAHTFRSSSLISLRRRRGT